MCDNPLKILIRVNIATYDRVDRTLDCITTLEVAARNAGAELLVTLVDASSPDGTAGIVKRCFPHFRVITVSDDYYWASAMRRAYEESVGDTCDYLLWLNDDVRLEPDSLSRLVESATQAGNDCVVTGVTLNPKNREMSYGGLIRGPWHHRTRLRPAGISEELGPVDLANGNILLIPPDVAESVGGFPKGFTHSMADLYFSDLIQRKGYRLLQAPGFHGWCEPNQGEGTFADESLSRISRLCQVFGPKGLPIVEWLRLCYRIGGVTWPIYFFAPYLRLFSQILLRRPVK